MLNCDFFFLLEHYIVIPKITINMNLYTHLDLSPYISFLGIFSSVNKMVVFYNFQLFHFLELSTSFYMLLFINVLEFSWLTFLTHRKVHKVQFHHKVKNKIFYCSYITLHILLCCIITSLIILKIIYSRINQSLITLSLISCRIIFINDLLLSAI